MIEGFIMNYNDYGKQLSDIEILSGKHRKFVGSFWKEIGNLQFEFLCAQGLRKKDKLLDIGCGALRGGIHFIKYLEEGNYTGIDANESLIRAGELEIQKAGLLAKKKELILDKEFNYSIWGGFFHFIVSISLFTHLPITLIENCISSVAKVMEPKGAFYFSFFLCNEHRYEKDVIQNNSGLQTHPYKDPYHQTIKQLQTIAEKNKLKFEYIGEWKHPRNQKMACLRNE